MNPTPPAKLPSKGVALSTLSKVSRRSVFAARRKCIRRLVPKLLPRARSSTRSGPAKAARECVRSALNCSATRARESTFSLSKRISFNGYWISGKRSAAVTHGILMNAISFHDASGRCAPYTPIRRNYPCRFSLLYPALHLTFHAKSIDADPSAEDGTIFFFLSLHLSQITPPPNMQRSSIAFSHFSFYPARSKLRMAMACLYLRDIPVVA